MIPLPNKLVIVTTAAVAPLGACPDRERRNTPVADRRYNLEAPPTYFVVYSLVPWGGIAVNYVRKHA